MVLYDDTTEPEVESEFDEFWGLCIEGNGASLSNRIGRAIARFAGKPTSTAGRILRSRDEAFDADAAMEEAYWRLRFLWQQLGL